MQTWDETKGPLANSSNPPDGGSTEADFDLLSFEDGETEGDEGLLDRDDVLGGHEGSNPEVGDFNDCWDKEKKEQHLSHSIFFNCINQ